MRIDDLQIDLRPSACLACRAHRLHAAGPARPQPVRGLAGITLLGKAEWANPGGSVKDRAAAAMVRDAIARGLLVPGKTLLDATSGNTGIALAMLGAALGFPVQLAMPSNVSPERKRILARLRRTRGVDRPRRRAPTGPSAARGRWPATIPDRFCYLDQYSNDANWLAHYHTTGPEIWEQTPAKLRILWPAWAAAAPSWVHPEGSRS